MGEGTRAFSPVSWIGRFVADRASPGEVSEWKVKSHEKTVHVGWAAYL